MEKIKRWMMNFIIITLLITSAFTCEDFRPTDEKINSQNLSSKNCENSVLNGLSQSLTSDPFSIEEISIKENYLKIKVIYGGGCKDVKFNLYQASEIMESFPPQMNLFLKLEDDDPCKALVFKELYFSLANLSLPGNSGTMIFNIAGYPEPVAYQY